MANINLLKTKSGISAQLVVLGEWLSRIGIAALLLVLVAGAGLATAYVWLAQDIRRQEDTKTRLVAELEQNRQKEGLLISLKRRAAVAEKIRIVQRPLGGLFTITSSFVPEGKLVSLRMDEQLQVQVQAQAASIEEVAIIILGLESLARDKRIINPQLVGLDIGKDGSVRLTVSFVERGGSG